MVEIKEEEEEEEINDTKNEMASSSSSSYKSNYNPQKSLTISPPPPSSTDLQNSSPSSISSDHTFHGFSPIKENITSPFPSLPPSAPATPPPPPPPPPAQSQSQSQSHTLVPVHGANRLVHDHPEVVTKTQPKVETGFAGEGMETQRRGRERGRGRGRGREKLVKRVGLGLRFCEFVVCLVSFSVMAADKNRGWALDSFDRYVEFRYAMTVNIIAFAYSGLQGLDLLHQLTTGKDLISPQIRYSFDFAIDQILAYLLLSASSSAFTRVDDWISNWGNDKFPAMASAAVGVSFVAFAAFAMSSMISGFLLCTHKFT